MAKKNLSAWRNVECYFEILIEGKSIAHLGYTKVFWLSIQVDSVGVGVDISEIVREPIANILKNRAE